MFTDEHRRTVWDQIRQHDLRAFAKWLSPELLTSAAVNAGIRVGNGPLYEARRTDVWCKQSSDAERVSLWAAYS